MGLLDYSQKPVGSQELRGHTNRVSSLEVLPNGRLVSGSTDANIRVWNIDDKHDKARRHVDSCEREWPVDGSPVTALAVSSNGTLITGTSGETYSGGMENSVRIWDDIDRGTNRILQEKDRVEALAVLLNRLLAVGYYDGTIHILDIESGDCIKILEGHERCVKTLAFTPDGVLASGSYDGTIRLWDVETGECLKILRGHSRRVLALAVLPNGFIASGSDDETIQVWDIHSGECTQKLTGHKDAVCALTVMPDGSLVSAGGTFDNTIRIWDVAQNQCLQCLSLAEQGISAFALAAFPDGRLVCGAYGMILVLNFPELDLSLQETPEKLPMVDEREHHATSSSPKLFKPASPKLKDDEKTVEKKADEKHGKACVIQ